jgi:hypothetical protein
MRAHFTLAFLGLVISTTLGVAFSAGVNFASSAGSSTSDLAEQNHTPTLMAYRGSGRIEI